jgi:hypothetical protein
VKYITDDRLKMTTNDVVRILYQTGSSGDLTLSILTVNELYAKGKEKRKLEVYTVPEW